MDFSDELVMLILVILVLGLAYMGLSYWSNRAPTGGAGSGGGTGVGKGAGGGFGAMAGSGFAGEGDDASAPLNDGMASRPDVGSRKNEKRFNLQGKDAELAAKVLKRMLKQGETQDDS